MDMKNFPGHSPVPAFETQQMGFPNLGEILVSAGRLDALAVERVTTRQKERGIPFGAAAVELGLVSQADVHAALAGGDMARYQALLRELAEPPPAAPA